MMPRNGNRRRPITTMATALLLMVLVASACGGGSGDVQLPDVDLPDVDLPDVDLPDVDLPDTGGGDGGGDTGGGDGGGDVTGGGDGGGDVTGGRDGGGDVTGGGDGGGDVTGGGDAGGDVTGGGDGGGDVTSGGDAGGDVTGGGDAGGDTGGGTDVLADDDGDIWTVLLTVALILAGLAWVASIASGNRQARSDAAIRRQRLHDRLEALLTRARWAEGQASQLVLANEPATLSGVYGPLSTHFIETETEAARLSARAGGELASAIATLGNALAATRGAALSYLSAAPQSPDAASLASFKTALAARLQELEFSIRRVVEFSAELGIE